MQYGMFMVRDSRESWLETGMELLTEDGPSSLTLDRLCQIRGKTKGSFYHHFSSVGAFTKELTSYWRQRHTQDLIDLTPADDPTSSIQALRKLSGRLPLEREVAFRSWARHDLEVAQAVREVDLARMDHLGRLLEGQGYPPTEARAIAWLEYAALLGMAQLHDSITDDERRHAYRYLERGLHHER